MKRLRMALVALAVPLCLSARAQAPALQVDLSVTSLEFTASYGWTIEKGSTVASAVLSTGQVLSVPYSVSLTRSVAATSGFSAGGLLTMLNPAAEVATLTSVLLTVPTMTWGMLDCGAFLPVSLAPGASLTCTWSATLPSGGTVVATGVATTVGAVAGGQATAAVDFTGAQPTTEIDECATVADPANPAFRAQACGTFGAGYLADVGPYGACGVYEVANTATFTANDTGATGSATHTLPVTVPCEVGCTLTPGYWKTHSAAGPAPYDDAWSLVGEDTPFFLAGVTWREQFWTPPAGNAYWQLASAYAAAALNVKNGASFDAVAGVAAHARELLEQHTPAEVGGLRGGSALRADFVSTAAALAAYNAGAVGPGHCDE